MRRALALLLAFALLSGCLSTRSRGTVPTSSKLTGGVQVSVFEDDDARKAGRFGPRFIAGELERRQGGHWEPVFRSLQPKWSVVELPPGKYRVRYTARLNDRGDAEPIEDPGKQVRVRAGKMSRVETTLKHVPTGWIVVGVVTVIVAAILLEDWFKDLPEPPVPPLPDIADAVFEITINTAFDGPEGYHSTPLPPVVTAHFPEEGALVAARSIRVVFAASEPLNPGDVESHGITVLGEKSGLVPGITRYDPEHWWVTWEPDGDLPRDELFHVTLGAEAVEDLDGNELPKAFSFTFRTAA